MEAADYSKMKRISGGFENFEKWGYEKDRYDAIMDQTKRNPQTFCEQIVGSRRKLYVLKSFVTSWTWEVLIRINSHHFWVCSIKRFIVSF